MSTWSQVIFPLVWLSVCAAGVTIGWALNCRAVGRACGFNSVWPAGAGGVLRESPNGDAHVNGQMVGGWGARLLECEGGYVVERARSFGGGYVLLPRARLYVVRYPPQGFWRRPCVGLFADGALVFVYGSLARFIAEPHDPPMQRTGGDR